MSISSSEIHGFIHLKEASVRWLSRQRIACHRNFCRPAHFVLTTDASEPGPAVCLPQLAKRPLMPGLAAILAGHHGALCHLEPARRRPAPYRPDQGPVAVARRTPGPALDSGGRHRRHLRRPRPDTGTIIGALTVPTTLLTILQMPEGARRILFGLIVLFVTVAYLSIVEER